MSGEKAMSGEVCCGVHHMHHTMKRAWLLKRDPDENKTENANAEGKCEAHKQCSLRIGLFRFLRFFGAFFKRFQVPPGWLRFFAVSCCACQRKAKTGKKTFWER